jgi:hypothetical protein
VLERVPQVPEGGDWEAQLRAHAVAAVKLLSTYPGLLKHGISRPLTPVALNFGEHTRHMLSAAGFVPQAAALATLTVHLYLLGTVVATELVDDLVATRGAGRQRDSRGGRAARVDVEKVVEFGVETLIAGLRARLRG